MKENNLNTNTSKNSEYSEEFNDVNKFLDVYNKLCNQYVASYTHKQQRPPQLIDKLPINQLPYYSSRLHNALSEIYLQGPLRMTELAQTLGITKYNCSAFVKKMIKEGHFIRFQKEGNSKNIYISYTEDSRKLIEESNSMITDYITNQFDKHTSPEERKELVKSFENILKIINKFD